MTIIPFDPATFRAKFQAFKNVQCFPDGELQSWWDTAVLYVNDNSGACFTLTQAQQTQAIYLMTAHQGAINKAIQDGTPLTMATAATIDKISVTVKPPPVQAASQFQWWLGLTPYGQALLAMLGQSVVGGLYIGGLPERAAIRRVGGGFGGVPPSTGRRGC